MKTTSSSPIRAAGTALIIAAIVVETAFSCLCCADAHSQNSLQSIRTARFVAGIAHDGNAAGDSFVKTALYREYSQSVDALWRSYEKKNHSKIISWSASHLQGVDAHTVLYPFSGPDVLNALAFFPNASEYVLIGMENPGRVFDLNSMPADAVRRGLSTLNDSLRQILDHNFFHTNIMKKNVGSGPLNSVSAIMQFFIVRSGYEVTRVRNIRFAGDGAIVEDIGAANPVAIEIMFRARRGGSEKKAVFIRADLSDGHFTRNTGLVRFLQSRTDYITMLKAASYLMFRRQFDDIRRLILAHSAVIVQDSSGIPYHYLKTPAWEVTLFGIYRGSIPLFRTRSQPELARDFASAGGRRLDFLYGYTSLRTGSAHLIVARKRSGVSFAPPVFDSNPELGEETFTRGARTERMYYR